jgi:sugar/nucleoside kinase (ribokinase family)
MGPDRAVVMTRTAQVYVPAPSTKVVAIGAGDPFGRAFIASWHARGIRRETDAAVEATISAYWSPRTRAPTREPRRTCLKRPRRWSRPA